MSLQPRTIAASPTPEAELATSGAQLTGANGPQSFRPSGEAVKFMPIYDTGRIREMGGWAKRREEAMTIESILRRKGTDVTTIAPEASVKTAADWLRAKNIGALVVTSENAVLGLISEREIVDALSRYGDTTGSMLVKEIMKYGVSTVSPDESVNRVMNLMTHHRVRHMPVLRGGKLIGIVSIGDIVKHRLEDLELETNILRDAYNAAR
jgi:CBS domain-containing protein